ncbi:hypothetical protein CHU_3768 [Cytophaga hutchinsonii ATCC 33406]|uniref:Uncharacterized protein n=1 Tax=Cytophaga hutchinsonii (strain ATCC 33406 / DSM 1761 / CIP 103989 / NBRC 15051 / NCIMB 9469 / D465) TaxID=269798 RepID=A0A6N4SXR4_CYTH3|nr:hypothetical protein CHU_3768 [Cytophaga hutchinsonii ATCC 33406]
MLRHIIMAAEKLKRLYPDSVLFPASLGTKPIAIPTTIRRMRYGSFILSATAEKPIINANSLIQPHNFPYAIF